MSMSYNVMHECLNCTALQPLGTNVASARTNSLTNSGHKSHHHNDRDQDKQSKSDSSDNGWCMPGITEPGATGVIYVMVRVALSLFLRSAFSVGYRRMCDTSIDH